MPDLLWYMAWNSRLSFQIHSHGIPCRFNGGRNCRIDCCRSWSNYSTSVSGCRRDISLCCIGSSSRLTMEIRNPTQFARFLSDNDLMKLDSTFVQLVKCINEFATACTCHKREDKMRIYSACNKLYFVGAQHVAPRLKNEFLSKTTDRQISFYTEQGQLLSILSR